MDLLPACGTALGAGYVLGSIPFSWIAVMVRTGQDLRTVGSGNAGATNASRVLGKSWFLPLFLLDAGKGAIAVAGADLLASQVLAIPLDVLLPLPDFEWVRVAGGTGAILGHILCPWLGFKGGKAVATGAGALAVLSPVTAAGGLVGFVIAMAAYRFVSLGSVVAALFALGTEMILLSGPEHGPVTLFVALLAAVVIAKHIPNLRRIRAGTEPRIGEGK